MLRVNWKRAVVCACLIFGSALQGCRAEQKWPLWQAYAAKFIDDQGRVIDHSAGDKTTSEGQAYAMFFSLVVGDRSRFDKLLHWTEDNLAQGDLTSHLPSWSWGKASDGSWKALDPHTASDADLWIAYDLLEAGRIWKIDRYTKLGLVIADRIAKTEVALAPGVGTVLLPGNSGFQHELTSFVLNPSYIPPQVIARMHQEIPSGPWLSILESYGDLLQQGSGKGFAMDWIAAGQGIRPSISPTELAEGKKDGVPVGGYDAIRVYLWLGMADPSTPGVQSALASVNGMAFYLQSHPIPPLQVDASGNVLNDAGTVGFSAAVMPYLLVSNHKAEFQRQMNRLDATLDSTTGLYGKTPEYYDQNLALFSEGWRKKLFRFDKEGRLKLK